MSQTSRQSHRDARVTRRQFLAAGATGFTLLCLGKEAQASDVSARAIDTSSILVKNPAYLKSPVACGTRLCTRTGRGETICFDLDSKAERTFDLCANVREYHAGTRPTVGDILAQLRTAFPSDDAERQRADCLAFLRAATGCGILLVAEAQFANATFRKASGTPA